VGLTVNLVGAWLAMAVLIALISVVFIEAISWLRQVGGARVRRPVRMLIGGAVVVALWRVVGTSDYLGLGLPVIMRAFTDPSLSPFAWALKVLFSVVTLGAGFLGGEVTVLFFIGAALGNAVSARVEGVPLELAVGVGLAAMFGVAARSPLTVLVMAMELMGPGVVPHLAVVALLGAALTGKRSIYGSARATPNPGVGGSE